VNEHRIVLAFNGHPASCAAVKWIDADVVALIVDVGQGDDPEEVYGRALACGASNAHVVDRCETFARWAVVPAASALAPLDERALRQLTYPVIAAALVDVAAIEGADTVAHASIDPMLDAEIHALNPTLRVLAPAREWQSQHIDVAEYVKMHQLPPGAVHPERHLLVRRAAASAPSETDTATVTIGFEAGVPRSVNGVAMELPELIESLSVIGGQYHIDDAKAAPALVLLQSAYRASAGAASVSLKLQAGSVLVVSGFSRTEIHA
jgi:argininosuccinate synthase